MASNALVERLRTRARIRREIRGRNIITLNPLNVEERDKIADLCDEAADEIERLTLERDFYERTVHFQGDEIKRFERLLYEVN